MTDFHFIRPLWLIAIIALMIMLFIIRKYRVKQSGWQQLLPKHLANVLVDNQTQNNARSLILPFMIGVISIIALAGPSWQKLPQPVYQVARGSVLIMDMSYSMYSTDVSPNRLTRARYKAVDLLDEINEGEIGLIAYAGDAFSISPLTEDINNIKLLLPSLSPDLMPEPGSNPYAALVLAHDMLKNAGHNDGDIYWFTDGVDSIDIQDITQWSREFPYRLNILGIGTAAGAPIKLSKGELMKDNNGAIIIPKLTEKMLSGMANRGRGNYVTLTHDSKDITQLTDQPLINDSEKTSESANTGDQWQEFGPFLLLLVLPLMLSYFRRGAVIALLPFVIFIMPTKNVYANEWSNAWNNLWKTKDQQGQTHFNQEEYQQASEQFDDPLWRGSAHYKAGEYEKALNAFKQTKSAQSSFNQGNALAKLQKLDEAIDAYQKALELDPTMEDAKSNKKILEELKKQQEQQQNAQQQDNKSEEQQDQENSEQQNSDPQNSEQDGQDQQSEQQSEQDKSDQNGQSSDNEQQNNEQSKQENENQESDTNQQETDNKSSDEQSEQESKQAEADKENEQSSLEDEQPMSAQAQKAAEQQAKETEQKHQQLLNKVTDDPYMLLRNKMQLEYQKRRQDRSNVGVKKKW